MLCGASEAGWCLNRFFCLTRRGVELSRGDCWAEAQGTKASEGWREPVYHRALTRAGRSRARECLMGRRGGQPDLHWEQGRGKQARPSHPDRGLSTTSQLQDRVTRLQERTPSPFLHHSLSGHLPFGPQASPVVWEGINSLGELTGLSVKDIFTPRAYPLPHSGFPPSLHVRSLLPLRARNSGGCHPMCKVGQPSVCPHFFPDLDGRACSPSSCL